MGNGSRRAGLRTPNRRNCYHAELRVGIFELADGAGDATIRNERFKGDRPGAGFLAGEAFIEPTRPLLCLIRTAFSTAA